MICLAIYLNIVDCCLTNMTLHHQRRGHSTGHNISWTSFTFDKMIYSTHSDYEHLNSLRPSDAYMRRSSNRHWSREWLVAWSAPSHHLNQCWIIVNWTLRNKLWWNRNRNSNIFIQENAFESVVCETAAILSLPQCVNAIYISWYIWWAPHHRTTMNKVNSGCWISDSVWLLVLQIHSSCVADWQIRTYHGWPPTFDIFEGQIVSRHPITFGAYINGIMRKQTNSNFWGHNVPNHRHTL